MSFKVLYNLRNKLHHSQVLKNNLAGYMQKNLKFYSIQKHPAILNGVLINFCSYNYRTIVPVFAVTPVVTTTLFIVNMLKGSAGVTVTE